MPERGPHALHPNVSQSISYVFALLDFEYDRREIHCKVCFYITVKNQDELCLKARGVSKIQ
jgi:hypothetical protein